ncbi:MAG: hypothetical protein JXQ79_07635 [Rhodobacteraceae bacterium]|nr:hypothetical protein [Paracoccaceae bacterium]
MAESTDNLVLEQLRLIREDLGKVPARFDDMDARFDELDTELHGHKMMIFGLSNVIGQIDKRVEQLETKIGE